MYSDRVLQLFHHATHGGELETATHRGVAGTPGEGPYLALALRVEAGVVREARWRTYGCPAAVACAEILCAVCEGRPLAVLARLTAADVARMAGGLPEGKEHCPQLAVQALRAAIGKENDG